MPYETGPTDTDPLTPQVLPVPVFLTQKGHVHSFFFLIPQATSSRIRGCIFLPCCPPLALSPLPLLNSVKAYLPDSCAVRFGVVRKNGKDE